MKAGGVDNLFDYVNKLLLESRDAEALEYVYQDFLHDNLYFMLGAFVQSGAHGLNYGIDASTDNNFRLTWF